MYSVLRRKYLDAAAAASCGVSVILIATGVKPVPAVISYLGLLGAAWGLILILSCLAAAVGAVLRTDEPRAARRRYTSVLLERLAWPILGGCTVVFGLGVVIRVGLIDGLTTLGFTGFVVFTCAGTWWAIIRTPRRPGER